MPFCRFFEGNRYLSRKKNSSFITQCDLNLKMNLHVLKRDIYILYAITRIRSISKQVKNLFDRSIGESNYVAQNTTKDP